MSDGSANYEIAQALERLGNLVHREKAKHISQLLTFIHIVIGQPPQVQAHSLLRRGITN